jgi:hypothetical protein
MASMDSMASMGLLWFFYGLRFFYGPKTGFADVQQWLNNISILFPLNSATHHKRLTQDSCVDLGLHSSGRVLSIVPSGSDESHSSIYGPILNTLILVAYLIHSFIVSSHFLSR